MKDAYLLARRPKGAEILVRGYGHVRPKQKGLGQGIRIAYAVIDLDIGAPRAQGHAHYPAQAHSPLGLTDPDRGTAIIVFYSSIVTGKHCCGPMVMWKAPFNTPRYPRPERADKIRFDNTVDVEHFVPVGLVHRRKQTPAESRQYLDLDIFVFQVHHVVIDIYKFTP